MMYTAGCVALLIAGQSLCFSGKVITCSDTEIVGVETCRALNARVSRHMDACKAAGQTSADGSSSSCVLPLTTGTGIGGTR